MSHQTGDEAEQLVLNHLLIAGHSPITCNYRCRAGEIDLITFDGKTLVFTEVKARRNTKFGFPAEFVNDKKQQKLIKTAKFFLYQNPIWHTKPIRFDVACVYLDNQQIEIIESAFITEG